MMPRQATMSRRPHTMRWPLTLLALLAPATIFALGLFAVRDHPRFAWLGAPGDFPWELWLLLASGLVATAAGIADWRYHRSGKTSIGARGLARPLRVGRRVDAAGPRVPARRAAAGPSSASEPPGLRQVRAGERGGPCGRRPGRAPAGLATAVTVRAGLLRRRGTDGLSV